MDMNPALRRGLMRANPGYFAMSIEEQERYRVSMPDEDEFIIEQQIFHDMLNVDVSTRDEWRNAHRQMPISQLNRFNEVIQPIKGIGDDCLWLNEYLGDKTLLDFETLYDHDTWDHAFQEAARERDFEGYRKKPYRGTYSGSWSRLFVDGVFTYGLLYCAASYIVAEIDSHGSDIIDRLIPHTYRQGSKHGQKEEAGFLFDMKVDANGKEAQLDELRRRFWQYQSDRHDELSGQWDRDAPGCAYLIPKAEDGEHQISFVYSDKTALRKVRFRHFIADSRSIEASVETLFKAIEAEKRVLEGYLSNELADIEQNFDPKIAPLRRKRKIIFAPEAIEDLHRISDTDEG